LETDVLSVSKGKNKKELKKEEQEALPKSMSTDNGGGGGVGCETEVAKEEQTAEVLKPEQIVTSNTPSGGGGIGELLRICKTKLGGLKQESKIISTSLDEQNNNNNNNNIENSNSNNKEEKLENELKKELKEPKESNEQNSNQPKSECNNSNHLTKSNMSNCTNSINSNQPASNKTNIMPKSQRPILEQTLSNLIPILPKPATTPINKKASLMYNSFPAPNSIINASMNPITTNNSYSNNVNLNSINNNTNNNIVVIQKHKNKMTAVESRNQRFEDIKNTYEQLINEMKINSGINFFPNFFTRDSIF